MNNQSTIDKMQKMRLNGMVRSFRETFESGIQDKFTADEMIAHLIDSEWDERYNRKFNNLLKSAAFRYKATIDEIDYSSSRKIDKNMILRFSTCDWIKKGESIIITGSTGTGKSFISCALGYKACMHEYRVRYYSCLKLFSHLKFCKVNGSYFKEVDNLKKQDLIILDDFGLKHFDSESRLIMLELIEDRHGVRSTIIASQLTADKWFEIIGDATIADAICDRLFHTSHKLSIVGPSMRRSRLENSGLKLPLE